jgi:CRISPR-associated endonuclease/helicase Cas3
MEEVKILAKSSKKEGHQISLSEHTNDVLIVLKNLKNLIPDDLYKYVYMAAIFHDLGKGLPYFQIRVMKNNKYSPNHPLIKIPHSIFSVLLLNRDELQNKNNISNEHVKLILSAIAYHHWREDFFELISSYSDDITELLEEISEKIKKVEENIKKEISEVDNNLPQFIKFNNEMAKGLKNGVPFSEYIIPPYQMYFLPKRLDINKEKMKDWILIAGFLQRADHFASFCEEEGEDTKNANPEISPLGVNDTKDKVKTKIKEKVSSIDEHSIWQLKKIDEYKDKNLILIAPTGYGKTEFAFLWGSDKKFVYTLPLRSAVNQIYRRSQDIFGEDKTGLLHSDADVFLLGDGGESQQNSKTYDLARQLAYPAIISTGDQFFPYALRPPGYEKIYATFSYSCLIIDEVQAYDPRAAAIVVKFIEHVVEMGGKFLLMTATLPEIVRKDLLQSLGNGTFEEINLYEEKKSDFKAIRKHKIMVELIENKSDDNKIDFFVPDEKLIKVLEEAKKGKRVLVIVNTVKQAKDIFEQLNNKVNEDNNYSEIRNEIYLLHSQFTLCDREKKEKNLEKKFSNPKQGDESQGKILVATQVVEASLNIDADVLFTEIAPLDALVQRMGRVLRRYGPKTSKDKVPKIEEPNVYVWVFKNGLQSGRHYVYDNELILLSLKILKDLQEGKIDSNQDEIRDWFVNKRGDNKNQKKENKKKISQEDLIDAILSEIFYEVKSNSTKKRSRQKKQSTTDVNSDNKDNKSFEFLFSEYDKYEAVKRLYESLPKDSSYLIKFQQTKDILDAGYMSDRKEEAQKMFREIYTLSAIPSQREKEFLKKVEDFLKRPDKEKNYTFFKRDVLSQFVIQIPNWHKNETDWTVDEWISIQDIKGCSEEEKKRISRWCQGIYFVEADYDDKIGILRNDSKTDTLIY